MPKGRGSNKRRSKRQKEGKLTGEGHLKLFDLYENRHKRIKQKEKIRASKRNSGS